MTDKIGRFKRLLVEDWGHGLEVDEGIWKKFFQRTVSNALSLMGENWENCLEVQSGDEVEDSSFISLQLKRVRMIEHQISYNCRIR